MDEHERSAFRAFVREHHPDRGGDPAVFVAGLARFGTAAPRPTRLPAEPDPEADPEAEARYDRPVEVVATLPLPVRIGVALIRTWHRRRHPRVR